MQGATAAHTWLAACFGCMRGGTSCFYMSVRMLMLLVWQHLVLPLPYNLPECFHHVLIPCLKPPRASQSINLILTLSINYRLLINTEYISAPVLMSRIFFYKLQTELWYWRKIFPEPPASPRNSIIPKLGFSSNSRFSRRASISLYLSPILLDSRPASNLLCLRSTILLIRSFVDNFVLKKSRASKTLCF